MKKGNENTIKMGTTDGEENKGHEEVGGKKGERKRDDRRQMEDRSRREGLRG